MRPPGRVSSSASSAHAPQKGTIIGHLLAVLARDSPASVSPQIATEVIGGGQRYDVKLLSGPFPVLAQRPLSRKHEHHSCQEGWKKVPLQPAELNQRNRRSRRRAGAHAASRLVSAASQGHLLLPP